MPIHDWTRVDPGTFHHFHQSWTIALCNALNTGGLPPDYFALAEQVAAGPIPDVLTLRLRDRGPQTDPATGGVAVAVAPPRARHVTRVEADPYSRKANRVTIRHRHGRVIAVIEIVSPGNKSSRDALRAFVEKLTDLLRQNIHLLVIDLFPPGKRDPQGIHKVLWDELNEEPFELPSDKRLTVASYSAGIVKVAYVEPVAVGDVLPAAPLFLEPEAWVPAPLEATYQTAWSVFPAVLKDLLTTPE
jgi:hypothetical protein